MSVEEAITSCLEKQTEHSFVYHVPADFPAFKGHFEGHPLLPGIGQLSFCALWPSAQVEEGFGGGA